MINGKHRSDMELVAQGAGNIASALFGGIPATGAIAAIVGIGIIPANGISTTSK